MPQSHLKGPVSAAPRPRTEFRDGSMAAAPTKIGVGGKEAVEDGGGGQFDGARPVDFRVSMRVIY